MNPSNPKLLALALLAALAAPIAMAGDTPPTKGSKAKATTTQTVKTPTASSSTKATASDAVSSKADAKESGRVMESPVHDNQGVGTVNPPPGQGNWWNAADTDKDGKLSVDEAKANAGVDMRFTTIDKNGDGFITTDEYRAFFTGEKSQGAVHAQAHSAVVTRAVWDKLDTNHDGKLSSSEVSADTTISGAFSVMDGNGDGFVTQDEYRAYAKKNL